MTHEPGFLTREQLLAYGEAHGRRVTEAQLKRWRLKGLMPSPTLVGLGRGEGMEARYPVEAGPQLIAVADALAQNRDADAALWRLWWEGAPVEESRLVPLLERALQAMEHMRRVLDAVFEDDAVSQRFDAAVSKRSPNKVMSRIRRRLGKSRFVSFIVLVYQMIAGELSHDSDNAALLARGLGFGASEFATAETFNILQRVIDVTSLRAALSATTLPGELSQARNELLPLWTWLRGLLTESPMPSVLSELDGATELLREALAEPPSPDAVLVWLRVRRHWLFPIIHSLFAARLARPFAEWENEVLMLPPPPRVT